MTKAPVSNKKIKSTRNTRKEAGASHSKANGKKYLANIGVFGFRDTELVVLAAMVTEDPMLLIGTSGTGKTFLLNSLSEALKLQHRHYNASLISFDDLVGFPYPDQEKSSVKFLETPATVWGAESVLIDEISRCKPEHQNRLFSLVHERKVQGIALPQLRFRWAAMNPCSGDQGGFEEYTGSEALDPALADRFAVFVNADDWDELSEDDRNQIANPGGEGKVSDDGGRLRSALKAWRETFIHQVDECPASIVTYAIVAVSSLNAAGIRISPRRSRLLSRSLLAATIIEGAEKSAVFKRILKASLPHPCWGVTPPAETVAAAHRAAWDSSRNTENAWVHRFISEPSLSSKLQILIDNCKNQDAGSQALAQLFTLETKLRAAAFAFIVYPAAASGHLPIGAEGVNDLGKVAASILSVEGEVSWQERMSESGTKHPDMANISKALAPLKGGRAERAKQFFSWALVEKCSTPEPAQIEGEINACVGVLKEHLSR